MYLPFEQAKETPVSLINIRKSKKLMGLMARTRTFFFCTLPRPHPGLLSKGGHLETQFFISQLYSQDLLTFPLPDLLVMPICLPIFESPSYEIMRYDGMDEKPKRHTIPTLI